MQKSQPLHSSSLSRALSLIILNTKPGLCNLYSLCSWQHFLGCSHTDKVDHLHLHELYSPLPEFSQVLPVPHASSSLKAHQLHRHVICDSQFKSALKLLSQTQIQIIWPSMPQSTNTIHLKKQSSSVTKHHLLKEISPLLLQNTAVFLDNHAAIKTPL